MLVLTRRKNQKILFPNLGISVQIVESRNGQVRLGVDAPSDVRIMREELWFQQEPPESHQTTIQQQPGFEQAAPRCQNEEQFRSHLDAANLAIHLARNQLKQGLEENADDALAQALISLQALEQSCLKGRPVFTEKPSSVENPVAVHETRSSYRVQGQESDRRLNAAITGMPTSMDWVQLCRTIDQKLSSQLSQNPTLSNPLMSFARLDSERELIDRIIREPRLNLDLVLIFSAADSTVDPESQLKPNFETEDLTSPVRVSGVNGLRPLARPIVIDRHRATAWVSNHLDLHKLVL